MTAEAEEQGASPLYPIREVSRLTGVNTVTLRAWERRYGLICPQRTPKGHRLYSAEDIETIHRVLQWLDQGVAVSQVVDLLDQAPLSPLEDSSQGNWDQLLKDLQRALEQHNEDRLDQLYCSLFASWSASQISREVLYPLTQQLDSSTTAALLARYLRSRIGERLYHRQNQVAGPRILLLPWSSTSSTDWDLLFGLHSLLDLDFRGFWLDTPIEVSELPALLEQQKPRAVLVSNPKQAATKELASLCQNLALPLAVLGKQEDANCKCLAHLDSQNLHQLMRT